MKLMKTTFFIALVLGFGLQPAFAQQNLDAPASEQPGSILGETQVAPMAGFTAINSTTGFNVGVIGGYRPWLDVALSFEPSFILGFYDNLTQINFDMGARYDLSITNSRVKPFLRAALGPTFQTKGDTVVFNAQLAVGVILPAIEGMDLRVQAAFVDIDGNAGFQLLAGVAL